MTTGWVSHERYMWHDTGRATTISPDRKWMQAWGHYENRRPSDGFRNLVEVAGLFDDLVALEAADGHRGRDPPLPHPAYVESIRAMSDASGGTPASSRRSGAGSFEIALLAAGGAITAVDAVLDRARAQCLLPWCGRPATTPRPTAVEGSASSTTSWWPSSTRGRREASAGWPRWTGTSTTATAPEGLLPQSPGAHHLHPSGSVVPAGLRCHRRARRTAPAPASTSTSATAGIGSRRSTSRPSTESSFRRSAHSGRS